MSHEMDDRILSALKLARIGFYRYLFDGTILDIDQVSFEFFELEGIFKDPESLVGQKIESLFEYIGQKGRLRDEIKKSGRVFGFEYHFRTLKGNEKWAIHSSYILIDEDTGKETVQVCFYEITDKKLIELSLRESISSYHNLVSTIPHGIVETDLYGKISFVNHAFAAMTGYTASEMMGTKLTDMFIRDSLYKQFIAMFNYEKSKVEDSSYCELKLKDSSGRILEVNAEWMKKVSLKNEEEGFVVVLTDVSEKNRLEALLFEEKKMDSIGELLSGISHDFNNLLASITGLTEIINLEKERLTPIQKQSVSKIFQTIKRASDLIGNIHYASGHKAGESSNFDLFKVTSEMFRILEETTSKKIKKKIDIEEGQYYVFGIESDIYQVLLNLSTNAIRAIKSEGKESEGMIQLFIAQSGKVPGGFVGDESNLLHIVFEDNGCGMDKETLDKAFIPFYSTKAKNQMKGQGLGLASVYYIITKKHGGFIEVESSPGEGTRFHLYLPRGIKFDPEKENTERRESLEFVEELKKNSVLVMEDEEPIIDFIEKALESFKYNVLLAQDGKKGLEIYKEKKNEIDFLIIDISMPVLSGAEVIKEIKQISPEVKIIVTSGHLKDDYIDVLQDACVFLRKPFTKEELAIAIKKCIDSE